MQINRITCGDVTFGSFYLYINYTYDEVGNKATMTDPNGNLTSCTYDAVDRITKIQNPSNENVTFVYNTTGRHSSCDIDAL